MRALAINSMFANAMYRRCADELGAIAGVDLTILTVDEWRMNGRPMRLDPVAVGSPYRAVIGRTGWRGYENRGFYRSGIARALRASRPEVIFLMEEPFSVFAAEILAMRKLVCPRTPVVFFTWNNLSLTTFDYRPSVFYRNVAKRTLPMMQYALTANSDGVDVLRAAGFRKPIKVVGYGVDTQAYSADRSSEAQEIRRALAINPGDVVVGYVGRILEMKGLDLLVDAVAALRAESSNLRLLLLGSGEYESALQSRMASLGIQDSVRRVQVVPHTHVPAYMQAMDVMVLPSRRVGMWAEQFGRVLVEAMASGRIVIGSTSGAIPEVIGDAGFVFKENDAADLTAVLRKALTLPTNEREALRGRAISRATHDYSWARFAHDAHGAMKYVVEERAR